MNPLEIKIKLDAESNSDALAYVVHLERQLNDEIDLSCDRAEWALELEDALLRIELRASILDRMGGDITTYQEVVRATKVIAQQAIQGASTSTAGKVGGPRRFDHRSHMMVSSAYGQWVRYKDFQALASTTGKGRSKP